MLGLVEGGESGGFLPERGMMSKPIRILSGH